MQEAGRILVEQLGEFLNCSDEDEQVLLDGPDNPSYRSVLQNLSPITNDMRFILFRNDRIEITETSFEFRKCYSSYYDQ